ncbi:MAG: hypothetical protein A2Y38_07720 [Spirochaetes bacterium GWB1_59_5]|nr:MAG: hypothetical protein A2Y38_07720 [Spirochaetes bacterium GWB1_59_5]
MSEQDEQRAMADLVELCGKHGRLVMLRVMGRLQYRWACQGLHVVGLEEKTETGEAAAPQRTLPGTQSAKPAAAAIGKAMHKLEGRRDGEGQR